MNSIIYRIVYSLLYISVFRSKFTRGSRVYQKLKKKKRRRKNNSMIYRIVNSLLCINVVSSKGTRCKKKDVSWGLGRICLSLCCLCRVYHQIRWTAQCTVKCTEQCTVKCSLQCTLYYWIWPILQYKAKLCVGTLNRSQGV